MCVELKAQYYIWKRQLLTLYKTNNPISNITDSHAYAISNDCYPVFHDSEESELFKKCFRVEKKFADKVIKKLQSIDDTQNYIDFNQLEADLGGSAIKYNLITVLRYVFLEKRFSNDLWKNLIKQGVSSEALNVTKAFSMEEVLLFSN